MTKLTSLAYLAGAYDISNAHERARSRDSLAKFFNALADIIAPTNYLEIGAYDAKFSREAKRRHPQASVAAFEANKYNFELFNGQHDYAALGVDYRWQAVSDRVGPIEFYVQDNRFGRPISKNAANNSMLLRQSEGVEYEKISVSATTLDAIVAELGAPAPTLCLWIDVEGATRNVLNGGVAAIKSAKLLMVEVEDYSFWEGQWLADDVVNFLDSYGLEPVARDFEVEFQYNIVFLSRDLLRNHDVREAQSQFVSEIFGRRKALSGHHAKQPDGFEPSDLVNELIRSVRSFEDRHLEKLSRILAREARRRRLGKD